MCASVRPRPRSRACARRGGVYIVYEWWNAIWRARVCACRLHTGTYVCACERSTSTPAPTVYDTRCSAYTYCTRRPRDDVPFNRFSFFVFRFDFYSFFTVIFFSPLTSSFRYFPPATRTILSSSMAATVNNDRLLHYGTVRDHHVVFIVIIMCFC